MPALKPREVAALLRRDDRGAVGTVFAILLAGGVLLGMLALVIDLGRLYAEREELQSGADSAAIAVANSCARATSATECASTDAIALAETYANANARDGASNVLEVCGTFAPSTLGACAAPIGNLTDCIPATPTDGRPYVEVRTGTEMPNGSFLLPPVFAQTLAGNGDYAGTTVRACARATIGTVGRGLGVTFSECEWNHATNNGALLPEGPQFVAGQHSEVVLKLHDSQGSPPPGCTSGGNPDFDTPGGFGWLQGANDCEVTFHNGTYDADTGNDPKDCLPVLDEATTPPVPKVLYIPIYQSVTKQGKTYTLAKVAAFVPTGYFFGSGNGKSKSSWLPGSTITPCQGQERCIYGYFVNVVVPGELGPPNLESLGATVVALSG
jgi:Flp pilus assembly protein TadG